MMDESLFWKPPNWKFFIYFLNLDEAFGEEDLDGFLQQWKQTGMMDSDPFQQQWKHVFHLAARRKHEIENMIG